MAPRIPVKLGKSKNARSSSGGDDGNPVSKSPSLAVRKFRKPGTKEERRASSEQVKGLESTNAPSGNAMSKTMGASAQPFEVSDGARRLNRILDSTDGGLLSKTAPVGGGPRSPMPGVAERRNSTEIIKSATSGIRKNLSSAPSPSSPGEPGLAGAQGGGTPSMSATASKKIIDYIPPSTIQLNDPTDEHAVGEMTCRISSKMRVDVKSIGGKLLGGDGKVEARTGNALLRDGWEDLLKDKDANGKENGENTKGGIKSVPQTIPTRLVNRLVNESLFSMCVSQFDLSVGSSGGPSGGKKRHIPITKSRNKLRYIVIARSTNRPLLRPKTFGADGSGLTGGGGLLGDDDDDDAMDNDDDLGSDDGYDNMYNPDPGPGAGEGSVASSDKRKAKKKKGSTKGDKAAPTLDKKKKSKKPYGEYDCGIPSEKEISSFPALYCLAIHADGTKPDVRKILELDKLVSIENSAPKKGAPAGSAGPVVVVFRNGDAVEINCDLPNAVSEAGGGSTATSTANSKKNTAIDATNRLRKERFLWSLLQIHAILCTAVVEQTAAAMAAAMKGRGSVMSNGQLPPLAVRNVDRSELQYISTVNNFLTDSPVLCSLLDRQSNRRARGSGGAGVGGVSLLEKKSDDRDAAQEEEGKSDGMDDMAYNMMMGNYNQVALFVNEEEKQDAADILNDTPWQQQEYTSDGTANVDASATADTLISLLQQRMRDLEAETCRRLISWEDEKYYSATGERPPIGGQEKNSLNAMSVNDLYQTLLGLDSKLDKMEDWIDDRATMVKPITDECRGIEEENRMLEQQWVSFEQLGVELKRLLGGLVLPNSLLKVLENPGSVIHYDRHGAIDVERSEEAIEMISHAGQALKLAIDSAEKQGGIHLRAVSDTVKVLTITSNKFCGALARIVVTVMEQLAKEVCSQSEIGKGDTHTSIAKKIREVSLELPVTLLMQHEDNSHNSALADCYLLFRLRDNFRRHYFPTSKLLKCWHY